MGADALAPGPLRARPRRADLPDVGAHLGVQPRVRALPQLVGTARPRRARRPPRRSALIDELAAMQVFYVNMGGGEPTIRGDFFELLEHAVAAARRGEVLDERHEDRRGARARRLAAMDYVDVQVSIDGATRRGQRRGPRRRLLRRGRCARCARSADAGFGRFKVSVVVTRENVAPARRASRRSPTRFGAQLRLTRLRPSGRGVESWDRLRPTAAQNRELYHVAASTTPTRSRATRSSTSRRSAQPLDGLNLCGAGRVVCLVDPIGDVYACPFAIHEQFRAGSIRDDGGFARGLARVGAVHRAACAGQRGRVRVVRVVGRVSRRVHGGEVLHRHAARRPGPRLRATATATRVALPAVPSAPTAPRPRGPRPPRRPPRDGRGSTVLERSASRTWPEVARQQRGRSSSRCRSARASSTARTCPLCDGLARRDRRCATRSPRVATTSSSRRSSASARAASTRASPARCRSAPRRSRAT